MRNARASQSAHKLGGLSNVDSMRQFNYLAASNERGVEDDVEQLEREIENVLKKTASTTVAAKGGTAVGGKRERLLDAHIVNMTTTGNFQNRQTQARTQTAGGITEPKRRNKLLPNKQGSTSNKNLSLGGTGLMFRK